MITSFLLLLLPAAVASGWFAAKRVVQFNPIEERNRFVQDYLVGLNYLLNEQPDKAVDTFIKMLEVDDETVETHLALGALFRRRGEVDRAIRIHQNLIARPQLPKKQHVESLLALAQDYLKAGVLDRAERLFLDVIAADTGYKAIALTHLLDIYQQQKRWDVAIDAANKLSTAGQMMQRHVAHYYCEQALEAHEQGDMEEELRHYLKRALEIDPSCARANLLLGSYEFDRENFYAALEAYRQIKDQDSDFVTEAIAPLAYCYEQLGRTSELISYLQQCLQEHPQIPVVLAIANCLRRNNGSNVAAEFLAKQLRLQPSVQGLNHLIGLHLETADLNIKEHLLTLQAAIIQLLKNKPNYRCEHCGFASKVLHWHCPGCKDWACVKPVQE